MADILLFHHAQGLTDGVRALAEAWRAAGHQVTTPDLYDGRTFTDLDAGLAYAGEIGFGAVADRGVAAAESAPPATVYVGLSLGVMPAQRLAQQRAGARGAVLMGSCVDPEHFGGPWPDTVPVQVHGMAADPIFVGEGDLVAAEALVAAAADAELFLYPGAGHLFVDASLADHDAAATALFTARVADFLGRVG